MREPAYQLFDGPPKARRGIFETRVDILKSLRHEPKRMTKVIAETNTSYRALRDNLDFMVGKGLLGTSKVLPRKRYTGKNGVLVFLTRKGMLVLDRLEAAYNELIDAESHEEELIAYEARAHAQAHTIQTNTITSNTRQNSGDKGAMLTTEATGGFNDPARIR